MTTLPDPAGVKTVALIVALQSAPVVTSAAPRNTAPSPLPDASHDGEEKNSIRYVVFATELSVPWIVVVPFAEVAEVSTG